MEIIIYFKVNTLYSELMKLMKYFTFSLENAFSWIYIPVLICSLYISKIYKFCKTNSHHNQPCNSYIILPYLYKRELSFNALKDISNFQQKIYPKLAFCISDINRNHIPYSYKRNQSSHHIDHRYDFLGYPKILAYLYINMQLLMSLSTVKSIVFFWLIKAF